MTDDPIDRAMTSETPIEPSPDFTARVMRAVRREAEKNEGLPFPWRLAAVPAAVATAALVVAAWSSPGGPAAAEAATRSVTSLLRSPVALSFGLVGAALTAAWATARLALGHAGR